MVKNYISLFIVLFFFSAIGMKANKLTRESSVKDKVAPQIATLSPLDNATNAAYNGNIVITFDQTIVTGTGNITIFNASDDSVFELIDVTSDCVSISGTTATINPRKNLSKNTAYYIQIGATAFENAGAESFAGIADKTTWNFTTAANTTPIFSSTSITTIDEDDVNYSYTITATDADADILEITPTSLPSWVTFNTNNTITTFAGSTNGSSDGTGTAAQFNQPRGIVIDKNGNTFMADTGNGSIRKITPAAVVTTLATGFNSPNDVVLDSQGNLYITDSGNHRIQKITPDGTETTFAGSGVKGFNDANGTIAQFSWPTGIVIDADDNIYVTEGFEGHRIRKITPSGEVTTLAGSTTGTPGFVDATGTAAQFNNPFHIEIGIDGNLFVTDDKNNRIRKVTPAGVVTTFSGTGVAGFNDGTAATAQFSSPKAITKDALGNLYVSQIGSRIRKIDTNGNVTTFIPSAIPVAGGLHFDTQGNLFMANDQSNGELLKITTDSQTLTGTVTGQEGNHNVVLNVKDAFGGSTDQSFTITVTVTRPQVVSLLPADDATNVSITADLQITFSENVNITDDIEIYDVSDDSLVETINSGDINVSGAVATLPVSNLRKGQSYYVQMSAFTFDDDSGNFFAGISDKTTWNFSTEPNTAPTITSMPATTVDEGEEYVYTITTNDVDGDPISLTGTTIPSWLSFSASGVTTFAGSGSSGNTDGTGTAATFSVPVGVVEDSNGNLFVADRSNSRIRKITPSGEVTTFAGSSFGDQDGVGTAAQFQSIEGITIDNDDNLYVTTFFTFGGNHNIRKITPSAEVSTLAGGARGFADGMGTAAMFDRPLGIVSDGAGNLYVADQRNERIRKINISTGEVTTLAGSGNSGDTDGIGIAAEFNRPKGITIDASGNLFVTDENNSLIRKITPAGEVSTFAGSGSTGDADGTGVTAEFDGPTAITIDANDNLFVNSNGRIRKITPSGVVTTIAGTTPGFMNGTLDQAQFTIVSGMTVDSQGTIIIVDNNRVRKLVLTSELKGTPTVSDIGSHPVVLNISDDLGANTDQSFTIEVLNPAPTVVTLTPTDDAIGVIIGNDLSVEFSETISANAGNITIFNASDDSVFEIIDVTSGNVSISGATATINPTSDLEKSGSYYVQIDATAFQDAGSANFAGISDKTTWSFETELKVNPTITFTDIMKTFADADFNLMATSNSTGTISYSIVAGGTGTASLSGTNNATVTLGNAGTVTIRATVAADANFNSSQKDIILTINKANPTITFADIMKTFGDADFNLMATSNSTGTISYSIETGGTGTASLSGTNNSTVTLGNAGTVNIRATVAEDSNYNSGQQDITLTINKANPTITFADIMKTFGDADFNLMATSNSTGTINYSIETGGTGTASLSGTNNATVTLGNAGTVNIRATVAADANFNSSQKDIVLTINKVNPTITFADIMKTFGDADFNLMATSNSTGTISYSIETGGTGTASLSGTNNATVTLGNAGTVNIRASIVSDANFNAGQQDIVLTVNKADQTITFDALDPINSNFDFDLTATASSGLPVSFSSSNTNVATISGVTVSVLAVGTSDITASQAGNKNYNAATSVIRTLTVQTLSTNDEDIVLSKVTVYPNPSRDFIRIDLKNILSVDLFIFDVTGKQVMASKNYKSDENIDTSYLKSGVYLMKIVSDQKVTTKRFIKAGIE